MTQAPQEARAREELLPCPFCGGPASDWDSPGFSFNPGAHPTCRKCGFSVRSVKAWNTRHRETHDASSGGVRLRDWREVARLAGLHGIRYRTNTALEQFLSALSPTSEAATADVLKTALPALWEYWLKDAFCILRSSGNDMHATELQALAAALKETSHG